MYNIWAPCWRGIHNLKKINPLVGLLILKYYLIYVICFVFTFANSYVGTFKWTYRNFKCEALKGMLRKHTHTHTYTHTHKHTHTHTHIYIYIYILWECWSSVNHSLVMCRTKCNIIWRVLNIYDRAIMIIMIINKYILYIYILYIFNPWKIFSMD